MEKGIKNIMKKYMEFQKELLYLNTQYQRELEQGRNGKAQTSLSRIIYLKKYLTHLEKESNNLMYQVPILQYSYNLGNKNYKGLITNITKDDFIDLIKLKASWLRKELVILEIKEIKTFQKIIPL